MAGGRPLPATFSYWQDDADQLYILPPCGRCHEVVHQVAPSNITVQVVLGPEESKELRELLLLHEWPEPLQSN
ncbi:MAG: hypothetical protein WKF83_16390 [Nocardioidaceae bacterium]